MEDLKMIKVRRVQTIVKEAEIEFDEKYCVDISTGEEIYDRDVEIENDITLYDVYKKQKNLLTSCEIKEIRKKYDLTQKEFANAIGVGEITVHRFENGTIQTESIDAIIRLAKEPTNMYDLITKNYDNLSEECFQKTLNIIRKLATRKRHKIAEINYNDLNNLEFKETNVSTVADSIIYIYNKWCQDISKKYGIESFEITHLKLQKMLYYVQGLCLTIFGEKAFSSKISAWAYGPVVDEIWQIYKDCGKAPINSPEEMPSITIGLKKIIEKTVESYGQIEANKLIDITHEEDPWATTNRDCEITVSKIKDYFNAVYNVNE